MNNPPDNILKKFEQFKETQEQNRTEKKSKRRKWIQNTWKFKYVKHKFKSDFAEPIPKEDGDIFYVMTQAEADELNRECAKNKSPYVYQKYKSYIDKQKKILTSKFGKDYPLLNEHLKRDARIEAEKKIKKLMSQVKKIKKNKK